MTDGPSASWTRRAAVAETAVRRRYLHRLGGLPGTLIGRTRIPSAPVWSAASWRWNFWWQAHLLDCLLDARRRAPGGDRTAAARRLATTIRLRNVGRWTNDLNDDIAWLGLALDRAGPELARLAQPALRDHIVPQLLANQVAGGIRWRLGAPYVNAPATGPAAILLARTGHPEVAARLVDWLAGTLLDPATGLIRDGVTALGTPPVAAAETINPTIYTYCQGVYLGGCTELAVRTGDRRWIDLAAASIDAITSWVGVGRVLPGDPTVIAGQTGPGGGDGGLFAGILARYLADAALRLPAPAARGGARQLVLQSAAAAWQGRRRERLGPVFAADWRAPGRTGLGATAPEGDLSVQLGAWMLLEAAATLAP